MRTMTNQTGGRYNNNGRPFWNRTGATIPFGGVAFIDEGSAEAESTTVQTALTNLTGVTTTLIGIRSLVVCVEPNGVADDAEGMFVEAYDGALVQIRVDGSASKGDLLKAVNAANHMVTAGTAVDRAFAVLLETVTDATAVPTPWCRLWSRPVGVIATGHGA